MGALKVRVPFGTLRHQHSTWQVRQDVTITDNVCMCIWGFPEIRCTILGVPIVRTIVFWGLHWGPIILGNYHILFGKSPQEETLRWTLLVRFKGPPSKM